MPRSGSAGRVEAILVAAGLGARVRELPASARSATEAAEAVGCELARIGKSMIFRAARSNRPVLVVASGPNRVDMASIAAVLGEPVERATPDFVRENTGFAIGGVPPVGHSVDPVVFIDESLMRYSEIWVAAGTPQDVFPLSPEELLALTGGAVIAVSE
ncbi:YbaK/EbsC family protein [Candidatus Rariloculus sp.]|uniref:YbaK/EbsC family protein n=1 Tax=Candidatus Rariloculus sp. TaxID=3101265 RepID=UPI003D0EBB27